MVRRKFLLKKKTTDRKTDLETCVKEQQVWVTGFREEYKDEQDLVEEKTGEFDDSKVDSIDEFPCILDEDSNKHIDDEGEKTCQVRVFNSTMDLTKV